MLGQALGRRRRPCSGTVADTTRQATGAGYASPPMTRSRDPRRDVVDGTGARAVRRPTSRSTATASPRSATVPATARREIDADGRVRDTRASSTSTPTSTRSSPGIPTRRRRAGTASPRSCSATAASRSRRCARARSVARRADGVGRGHPGRRASSRASPGTGRPTASTSRAIDAHAQGRERRRHGRALRGPPLRDGRTQPRRDARDRRRHRARCATSSTRRWARARSASRRRARCCTAFPTAGPVPGTWADERELLAIADVLGRHGQRRVRGRAALRAPGRELRRHARRGALDGRDQPAHRPAGHVRPRAEQRGPGAVPQDPRARRRGGRRRRRAAAADDRARHRTAVRSAAPHVLRPRAGVGRAAAAAARRAARRARRRRPPRRAARAPRRRTLRRSTGSGVYVLTARRRRLLRRPADVARRATPSAHGETIAEAFVAHLARDRAAGRCSTTRSSTSGWTRSRSCSTTRAWRSVSATPARTSA